MKTWIDADAVRSWRIAGVLGGWHMECAYWFDFCRAGVQLLLEYAQDFNGLVQVTRRIHESLHRCEKIIGGRRTCSDFSCSRLTPSFTL